jgi:hypothetical protein
VAAEEDIVGADIRSKEELAEAGVGKGLNRFVGIDLEDPFSASVVDGLVPCGGEVVAPGEVEEAGVVGAGNVSGPVAGACVHNDDLVDEGR